MNDAVNDAIRRGCGREVPVVEDQAPTGGTIIDDDGNEVAVPTGSIDGGARGIDEPLAADMDARIREAIAGVRHGGTIRGH